MTEPEMAAAIFKRFNDVFPAAALAALGVAVPYAFENQPRPESTPFAYVEILDGDSEEWTIGPRAKVRREGTIVVRLTGAPDVGRKQLDLLAQVVRDVYERRHLYQPAPGPGEDGVALHAATVTVVRGDRDRDQLRVVNVGISFDWYETRGS